MWGFIPHLTTPTLSVTTKAQLVRKDVQARIGGCSDSAPASASLEWTGFCTSAVRATAARALAFRFDRMVLGRLLRNNRNNRKKRNKSKDSNHSNNNSHDSYIRGL